MSKTNKAQSEVDPVPENVKLCGPVEDLPDVLVYSSLGGWRIADHYEYVNYNRQDCRQVYDRHKMKVPPGLSYQSGGLWKIFTRQPGDGKKDQGGSFFEYIDDGGMFVVEDPNKIRESKINPMISNSGDILSLERMAETITDEKVLSFIREHVASIKKIGDGTERTKRAQKVHNRQSSR